MDFSEFVLHHSLDGIPSFTRPQRCRKDATSIRRQMSQFSLPFVPVPIHSQPRPDLKRSRPEPPSHSSALVTTSNPASTQKFWNRGTSIGKRMEEPDCPVPSGSVSTPSLLSTRNVRHKGLPCCSISNHHELNNDDPLGLSSLVQNLSEHEVACQSLSAPSLTSSIQSLSNEVSPATSITTEHNLNGTDCVRTHNVRNGKLAHPYSSSLHSPQELLSSQSEFFCSDGSVSSELIGFANCYGDLNQLIESMLNDLNKVGNTEDFMKRQTSQIGISIPTQDGWQLPGSDVVKPIVSIPSPQGSQNNTHDILEPFGLDSLPSQERIRVQFEDQNSIGGLPSELISQQKNEVLGTRKDAGIGEIFSQGLNLSPNEETWPKNVSENRIYKHPDSQFTEHFYGGECFSENGEVDHCDSPSNVVYDPNFSPEHFRANSMDEFSNELQIVGLEEHNRRTVTTRSGVIDQNGLKQETYLVDSSTISPQDASIESEADLDGIRIVHLLVAAAEAVATHDVDLASVILVRLKDFVSLTGSTMQRVASYFKDGLQCHIDGDRAIEQISGGKSESTDEILGAFRILHEISPFIKFSHFTANQSILETIGGERRVHIIDYDIMEGIQWPFLMQALADRQGGPPHLRITAICRLHGKRGLASVQETGKRLSEFAASLNVPFTFNQLRVDNEYEFRPSLVKIIRGELLVVNCMLHLPHMPHRTVSSLSSFLQGVRKLRPALLTLGEDELGCGASGFTFHFFEALHHYSAMLDSLEVSFSPSACAVVERLFVAPRITSTITCDRSFNWDAEDEVNKRNWFTLVSSAGFNPVPLSIDNLCQARLLLRLFKDGFRLDEDHNRLLLGWHSKPLFAVSAWNCK